jgi:hypothetical protein
MYLSKVGEAGLADGEVGGFKVAVGGLLVSWNYCWSVYKYGRLLGGGSFCGAGVVVCGDALSV